MPTLGERLIAARVSAGHRTCEAGAAHCRLAKTSLYDYEQDRSAPGALALIAICRRYKVSADEILGLPRAAAR